MMLDKVLYRSVTVFDLMVVAIILIIAIVITKALSLYLKKFLREKVARGHLEIFVKITSYSIFIVALIIILPLLGVKPRGCWLREVSPVWP